MHWLNESDNYERSQKLLTCNDVFKKHTSPASARSTNIANALKVWRKVNEVSFGLAQNFSGQKLRELTRLNTTAKFHSTVVYALLWKHYPIGIFSNNFEKGNWELIAIRKVGPISEKDLVNNNTTTCTFIFRTLKHGVYLKIGSLSIFFYIMLRCCWCLPVCVLLCIFRFSDLANIFPHPGNGHGNGFSPVCTRM